MSENRRAILEGILHSDDTTPMEKLKAEELLQELDRLDPSGLDCEFYADLRRLDESGALTTEDLLDAGLTSEEIAAWFEPARTVEERVELRARERTAEILADDQKFQSAVEGVARDLVKDAVRAARKQERKEKSDDAPSAVVVELRVARETPLQPPEGIDMTRGWSQPKQRTQRVRTTFEDKLASRPPSRKS